LIGGLTSASGTLAEGASFLKSRIDAGQADLAAREAAERKRKQEVSRSSINSNDDVRKTELSQQSTGVSLDVGSTSNWNTQQSTATLSENVSDDRNE
jgi:hypothetical protein